MAEPQNLSQKIGDLCLHWAFLDQKVDRLFEIFLQIDATQVACIVASMENFRQRCETLKRLIVNEPPTDNWADLLPAILDFLSAKMAPQRNRFVHDVWLSNEQSLTRVDKRATVRQYGAGDRDHVAFNLHYPTDMDDIHSLTAATWNMANLLDWIIHDLSRWRKGQIEEPSQQLIEQCSTYFELLHHPWPKQARRLLPQDNSPKSNVQKAIENSYIVLRGPESEAE